MAAKAPAQKPTKALRDAAKQAGNMASIPVKPWTGAGR